MEGDQKMRLLVNHVQFEAEQGRLMGLQAPPLDELRLASEAAADLAGTVSLLPLLTSGLERIAEEVAALPGSEVVVKVCARWPSRLRRVFRRSERQLPRCTGFPMREPTGRARETMSTF